MLVLSSKLILVIFESYHAYSGSIGFMDFTALEKKKKKVHHGHLIKLTKYLMKRLLNVI